MLRKSTGNMYDWVTHTWNPIKGKCPHDCFYCYMKRWGEQKELRLDEQEIRTNLGRGNFIFVGSGTDMFAEDIPSVWIERVLWKCNEHEHNRYLFQTKNPFRLIEISKDFPSTSVFCTTIETNRWINRAMGYAPHPFDRAFSFNKLRHEKYVTIEPIMDFDLQTFVQTIEMCEPVQVNIGADSGGHNLPEPSADKVLELIEQLQKFTTVKLKKNLNRIIGKEIEDGN